MSDYISSENENNSSIDSLPSMASERSTHISQSKQPYKFKPKMFQKEDEQDASMIKDHIEIVEKPINTHFKVIPDNFDKTTNTNNYVQENQEYEFELNKSDSFIQPNGFEQEQHNDNNYTNFPM